MSKPAPSAEDHHAPAGDHTDTDAAAGFVRNPDSLPYVIEPIALNRVGEPKDVVGAVIYFASAASSYTTGTCMTIDGGIRP